MWLTRFAISRPVVTAMLFIALALFGVISFFSIGRSSNPPGTAFPIVVVIASYPGASPQEMERLIVKPIEDQLDGIENLDQLTATAQEGQATVGVQFKLGTDLNVAAIDVQRAVDTARIYMPSDLNPPFVYQNGASEPLLDIAISSNSLSPAALTDMVTNRVEPMIKAIPNIQTVDVYGGADREFHVEPIPERLVGVGATLTDVFNAVAHNNANLPGGILEQPTQETTVSVHAEINSASDLLALPLAVPGGASRTLRVGDVAYAYDSHIEQRMISHYNGVPRLYVELNRNINADEITSTKVARERIKQIAAQFPQLSFSEIDAPADYTQAELNGVWQSLFEGIVLTAIVMMLFLHAWRNAAVIMVAIPTSILSTFVVMHAFGFHFDTMSLMGLSLIIGILVDDSIVVLENITRHRDMGEDPTNAAINGRSEIGGAAIAITMVDVIVFLPIAFLPGLVGRYLREFGAVIVVATLFSLLVSFTLTPLLAAKWSMRDRSASPPKWIAWFTNGYERLLHFYRERALPLGLRHGYYVVFVCGMLLWNALMFGITAFGGGVGGLVAARFDAVIVVVLAIGLGLGVLLRKTMPRAILSGSEPPLHGVFNRLRAAWTNYWHFLLRSIRAFGTERRATIATFGVPLVLMLTMPLLGTIGFDFVPQTQTGEIDMTLTYPPGTPLITTARYTNVLENAILQIDGIKSVSSTVGRKPSGFGSFIGGNYAQLNAQTLPNRRHDTNAIIARIRQLAYLAPGGEFQVQGDTGGGSGSPIFYSIAGPDDQINATAEKIAQTLRAIPGSVNVSTSAEIAAPRLNVSVDAARAAVLGVAPADAALAARLAIDGGVATKVRTENGLVDVRVQFPKADRTELYQLENVRVRASDGMLVPLSDVAAFQWTKAPTKIERLNRQRVVNVTGSILPGYSLGAVTGPLEQKMRQPGFLPDGVTFLAQGDTQYADESFIDMMVALLLSFVLVYMLMVVLYGSILEPLIVMFSVPLAIIGALLGLAFMHVVEPNGGQSLNIISIIGIVMLFGLVAKNGILLVDYSNTLCKRGMRVRDAVLQAAMTRFRPILMTTCAMIFGMLPLALGFAEGAEWRQAMGTVIIGGLTSSLILTLFLVPMIYDTWMGALERRADRRALQAEMEPVPS